MRKAQLGAAYRGPQQEVGEKYGLEQSRDVLSLVSVELADEERRFTGEPVTFSFQDADLKDVLLTFASKVGLEMAIDPRVSGSVSANLHDVPWDQALEIILQLNRCTYILEGGILTIRQDGTCDLDGASQNSSVVEAPAPSPYFSPIPTATTDTPHPAVFFATRPSKRTASAPASVESRKTQQGTTSRPSRYGIGEKYGLGHRPIWKSALLGTTDENKARRCRPGFSWQSRNSGIGAATTGPHTRDCSSRCFVQCDPWPDLGSERCTPAGSMTGRRMPKPFSTPHLKKLAGALIAILAAGFFGLNLIAWNQVGAMTEFVESGRRTQKPEDLSLLSKAGVIITGVKVPRPGNARNPGDFGLEYEEVEFPNHSGATLSAWFVGPAEPSLVVILFHGYAASKESLIPTAVELHDLGYASLLVDFYGSGDSSGSGTSIGFREAEDVATSLAFVSERWAASKKVAYGFSMGGAAVLRAVATTSSTPDAIIIESVFDRLLNAVGMRFRAMGLPARPMADVLMFWGGRKWGFDAYSHNPAEYARRVDCPVLLLYGDSDARVGKGQAQAIHQNLRTNSRLVIIPNMGHQTAIGAAPKSWRAEVSTFLAGI